ncbi:hypothetical protein CR956_01040 [Candidatus Saccharibacteria bacterium]|nr:MAG: hypothetical protein CR956_01040 [Candidatus Saccharibacteria bacterium]
MPRKHHYSQHFLRSPRIAAELIGHSNLRKNDVVYDLGAGSGVITSVLARRVGRVVAVELEPQALTKLTNNLGRLDNVEIVSADIRNFIPSDKVYKVFCNPPFAIISELITKLVSLDNRPQAIYLIAQKQLAYKLCPSHSRFTSALGNAIAPFYKARIRKPLHKTDFTPPPAVDTVLLELKLRPEPLLDYCEFENYHQFVLKSYSEIKKFRSLKLNLAGISPESKPSELSPEQWVKLYKIS